MHDRKQLNSLRLNNGMVYGNVVDYVTLLWICTNPLVCHRKPPYLTKPDQLRQ
jgi:hypothetical protein